MAIKQINPRRRALLRAASVSAAGLGVGAPALAAANNDPWARAQGIIDKFRKPLSFPKRDFAITAYGAKACDAIQVSGFAAHHEPAQVSTPAPGATDCYAAIAAAIAACSKAGGGRAHCRRWARSRSRR